MSNLQETCLVLQILSFCLNIMSKKLSVITVYLSYSLKEISRYVVFELVVDNLSRVFHDHS